MNLHYNYRQLIIRESQKSKITIIFGLLVIVKYKGIQWHNDNNASDVAYARAIGNTIAINKRTVMAPIYLCVSLATSKQETLIPSIDGK